MSIVGEVLDALFDIAQILPRPFETKYAWNRRLRHLSWRRYDKAVRNLEDQGIVKVIIQNNLKFIKLTKKGQLDALLARAKFSYSGPWDRKWRLIVFDIPEGQRDKRALFRKLLKIHGFVKLQASVYVNPYPINRSAIEYLKKTKLTTYIRILRVDDIDEDKELKKKFKLK